MRGKGFTLIELLVVIAIIAILSVVGVVVFRGVTSGARDSTRKADVDAITNAYEVKASGGSYVAIGDTDFASGKKPKDPNSAKGDYFTYLASDKSGYKVCASLDSNPIPYCNTSATNCYCKFSSQSTIISGSTADNSSTNYGSGPGGSSPLACDQPNGTLAAGLVGYWKMDEVPGSSTVTDSSGNGNSGTGASIVTPPHTQSFPTNLPLAFANTATFNGSSGISIPNNIIIGNSDFTIGLWINSIAFGPTDPGDRLGIFGRQFWQSGPDIDIRYLPGTGLQTQAIDSNSNNTYSNIATNSSNANQWLFIVVTGDRDGNLTIYKNLSAGTPRSMAAVGSIGNFNINLANLSGNWPFSGMIDDVRIYNRVLSQQELNALYAGCISP